MDISFTVLSPSVFDLLSGVTPLAIQRKRAYLDDDKDNDSQRKWRIAENVSFPAGEMRATGEYAN